jgi:hypothetical protein
MDRIIGALVDSNLHGLETKLAAVKQIISKVLQNSNNEEQARVFGILVQLLSSENADRQLCGMCTVSDSTKQSPKDMQPCHRIGVCAAIREGGAGGRHIAIACRHAAHSWRALGDSYTTERNPVACQPGHALFMAASAPHYQQVRTQGHHHVISRSGMQFGSG